MPVLEPLRLELSADELGLLAEHLGSQVPAQSEAPISAEGQALAVQSLQRRGLMNVLQDGTVQMDNVVGAVLGTCAYPRFSIVLRQTSPRSTVDWSIHLLGEMAVEQRHLEDERYLFIAYASAGQVLQRMTSALNVGDQPRPAGELIALERAVLDAARDAAGAGTLRELVEALRSVEVPVETSQSIALLLTSFEEVAQLMAFQHPPGAPPLLVRELTLLRGPAGFWAFAGPVEDSDDLYAAPLSGTEVRLLLTALLTLAIPN